MRTRAVCGLLAGAHREGDRRLYHQAGYLLGEQLAAGVDSLALGQTDQPGPKKPPVAAAPRRFVHDNLRLANLRGQALLRPDGCLMGRRIIAVDADLQAPEAVATYGQGDDAIGNASVVSGISAGSL
jgi:hypothetical protein